MKRRAIADWSAGALAIAVLALGALVVVKPAVDHWNDLYRGDPYRPETTTQTVRTKAGEQPAVRTTVTRKAPSSAAERVLGKGGLLFLRLAVVALAAFLAAAVLHRVVLGSYGIRAEVVGEAAAVAAPGDREVASRATEEPRSGEAAASDNGHGGEARAPAPEANGSELASSIGKFVAWRREELGLSQRELGKRAGISHTVISRLESGQQVPSPKTLERLAEAFRN